MLSLTSARHFFIIAMILGFLFIMTTRAKARGMDIHSPIPTRPAPKRPPVVHPLSKTATPAQTLEQQLDFAAREATELRREQRHQTDEARRELSHQRGGQRWELEKRLTQF